MCGCVMLRRVSGGVWRRRRGGGGGPAPINEPSGVSPLQRRGGDGGWELPLLSILGLSTVVAIAGTIYKPNTNIEKWALEEAAAREQAESP